MKQIVRIAMLAAAAVLPALATAKPVSNWLQTISVTEAGSHVLGNPQAKVRLTEYVSYTCGHCGTFHTQADSALKLVYVQPGKVSLEIRHVVRDPVDLTVAMLTNCGKPAGFFQRHNDFMTSQNKWLAKLDSVSQAQQARWQSGPVPARLQAVANDFGFHQIMARRGFSTAQVNACLGDKAMVKKLTEQSAQAAEQGVHATPSFALDGVVLAGTHDWSSLQTQLAARF